MHNKRNSQNKAIQSKVTKFAPNIVKSMLQVTNDRVVNLTRENSVLQTLIDVINKSVRDRTYSLQKEEQKLSFQYRELSMRKQLADLDLQSFFLRYKIKQQRI